MKKIVLEYRGAAQTVARKGGKSGLHRAGCRITSGGGDSKTSAIEKKQPVALSMLQAPVMDFQWNSLREGACRRRCKSRLGKVGGRGKSPPLGW